MQIAMDHLAEHALIEISRAQRQPAPDKNPKLLATALMLAAMTASLQATETRDVRR